MSNAEGAGTVKLEEFGAILERAFEAQLDGEFLDAAGGKVWLEKAVRSLGHTPAA